MNSDVKTVQRARGWRECEYEPKWWHHPEKSPCQRWVLHDGPVLCSGWQGLLPDPLADTPKGWYEFGQILKWVENKRHTHPYLPWAFEIRYYGDNSYSAAFWLVGNRYTAIATSEASGSNPRAAFIAALAAAIRHGSEATR